MKIQELVKGNTSFKERYFHLRGFFDASQCPIMQCAYAERSDDFIVRVDMNASVVYICNADGTRLLAKYEPEGVIAQLTLEGHLLYIVEKLGQNEIAAPSRLIIFDLNITGQTQMHLVSLGIVKKSCPSSPPVCIGKDHLIYREISTHGTNVIRVLPKSSFNEITNLSWVNQKVGMNPPTTRYYLFAKDQYFIQVACKIIDCKILFDISKIIIREKKLTILNMSEGIFLFRNETKGKYPLDICLSMDRLFFAYEKSETLDIFFYDMITGQRSPSISIDKLRALSSFKPLFLTLATRVYFSSQQVLSYLSNR